MPLPYKANTFCSMPLMSVCRLGISWELKVPSRSRGDLIGISPTEDLRVFLNDIKDNQCNNYHLVYNDSKLVEYIKK